MVTTGSTVRVRQRHSPNDLQTHAFGRLFCKRMPRAGTRADGTGSRCGFASPRGTRGRGARRSRGGIRRDRPARLGAQVGQTGLVERRHERDKRYYAQLDIDAWVVDLCRRLAGAEPGSIEEALRFLERDPYFFRSGYARERVARRLARIEL